MKEYNKRPGGASGWFMSRSLKVTLGRGRGAPWWLLAVVGTCAAAEPPAEPLGTAGVSGPDLEGALIGDIDIRAGDVFDPNDPREDRALHRVMNTLHIETRDDVIRRQLLINTGDEYSQNTIDEAERVLRENGYLSSAEIVPTRYDNGTVDLAVVTEDAWSLTPSISFSRKGGRNTGGVEIEESNLLGSGTELKFGYRVELERDERYIAYRDRQLGDTWLSLNMGFANNSDGSSNHFLLEQPFYALNTKNSYGVYFNQFNQVDPLYRLGEVESEVQHEARQTELFYGWSKGLQDGWVRRWRAGIGYDDRQFTPMPDTTPPATLPPDHLDVYPFISMEWLEDRYETITNTDSMEVVEDRHLGARYTARLGYASTALGSHDNAWLMGATASRGFHIGDKGTLMMLGSVGGRLASTAEDQYRFSTSAKYYHRQSEKRLFVAEFFADAGKNFDTDKIPTLGGETGLRGYPVAYQSGDSRVLLQLEQRVFTDWYPFRLFRVGGAAFFDVGQVWGGADDVNFGMLRDAGIGLRISSPRSSSGRMLHVNLAWPLDGPQEIRGAQLVIETRKSF